MQTYVALLRGINVSGKKIVKMEDLRKLMEGAGYGSVKTYIQSGNVVFEAKEKSKTKIAEAIEKLIGNAYGFEVTVFVLDMAGLEKAIDNNPFAENREPEGSGTKKIYVTFLSGLPSPENLEKLKSAPIGEDRIALFEDILYFKLAVSAADSKLSNTLIESKLKLKATTRNWNTSLKLHAMLDEA
jgi:uncharacterized protein (DUF1697 family)